MIKFLSIKKLIDMWSKPESNKEIQEKSNSNHEETSNKNHEEYLEISDKKEHDAAEKICLKI